MILVTSLYLLSLIIWIGSILFFSFVGAPSLFKALPPEFASKAVGAIFPKYYPLGYISGMIAFVCLLISAVRTGHWPVFKMFLVILMIGFTVYTSLVIHPHARALKEEIHAVTGNTDITLLQKEFDRAHHASVFMNGVVLLLGLILVFVTASRLTL